MFKNFCEFCLKNARGSCYRVTASEIRLWQPKGVVKLPRSQVSAVKPRTVSHVIVRLYDGHRFVLDLFHLSNSGFKALMRALEESVAANRRTRAARRKGGMGDRS